MMTKSVSRSSRYVYLRSFFSSVAFHFSLKFISQDTLESLEDLKDKLNEIKEGSVEGSRFGIEEVDGVKGSSSLDFKVMTG